MKPWKKIVRLLVLAAILIPTVALVAVQVPAVQTALVGRVTQSLTRNLNGDISVGKVYLSLPNNLILKDVCIVSNGDTLLAAGKVLLRVSTPSLVFSDQAVIRRVSLENGRAAIRRLDDSTTTLSALLAPLKDRERDTTTSLPWNSVKLNKLTVKNFGFTFDNRPPELQSDTTAATHVDWKNIRLEDINLTLRNLSYEDGTLAARADQIAFREQCGLDLQQLSGDIRLDGDGLSIESLEYDDGLSQLHAQRFALGFKDFSDFSHFLEKVSLDVSLNNSVLDLQSLHRFTGIRALAEAELPVLLDGAVSGPFNDLRTDLFRIQSPSRDTRVTLKGRVKGLSDPQTMYVDAHIFDGVTRTADIADMADRLHRGIDTRSIRKLAAGESISLKGDVTGRLADLKADLGLGTATMGSATVNARLGKQGRHLQAEGQVTSNDLHLGRILGQPSLGALTADAVLTFDNAGGKTRIEVTPAVIGNFSFRGYDYHGIEADIRMLDGNITADVHSDDPNLKMRLSGDIESDKRTKERHYRLWMELDTANLTALNFDKREGVTASLSVLADVLQTADGALLGEAVIRDLHAQMQDQSFDVGDVYISSTLDQDRYNLSLNSSVAKADYDGNVFVGDFVRQAAHVVSDGHLNSVFRNPIACDFNPEAFGSLMIRTLNLQPVCSFIAPELFISRESSIGFSMLGDEIEGRIASELMASGGLFVRNLQGRVYNQGSALRSSFNVDRIESGEFFAENIGLDATADDTGIDLHASFENDDESRNCADIRSRLTFGDIARDGWKLKADIRPSALTLAGATWNLEPASVFYREKHIRIDEFALCHEGQSLEIDGVAGDQPSDTLNVWLNDFDLNLVNAFIRDDFNLQGKLTGEGEAISLLGEGKGVLFDLYGKELSMAGHAVGDMRLRSNWDDAEKAFKVLAYTSLESRHPMRATASYLPSGKDLDLSLQFDRFPVGYLEPVLGGIASEVDGSLSGGLRVKGPTDRLDVSSENTRFNGLTFKLDYTQVVYTADGPFTVTSQGVTFDNIDIRDKFNHPAILSGGVTYDHFKNLRLGVRIDLDHVMGLNTKVTDNSSFYGRAFADGSVRILGTTDNIRLSLNLTTRENSTIHIPMSKSSKEKNSLLTFINTETKPMDLYDSLVLAHRATHGKQGKKGTALSVNLRLNATPDAEIQVEVDRSTGDILKARGNGQIGITAGGADQFDIKGDYRVDSGNYHFGMLGLTSRDFSIDPGGTLAFNGDIMDSDLDLTATYRTKASLSPLIADSTAVSTRRTVECGIAITGKLANPNIGFKINVPDLDPSTQSRVESAFNTEDKRMKQALALLISGSFVPDEQSGIVNSTTILFANASEMMAGQINNIFRQLEIPVDLGFNYQPTETGRSIFDVAVSTQLFNNRVSINGTIGNRQYISSSNSDIVGDLDIEIKLNRQGQLRLTLFSHSADQYSNYLDQSQRNGAGIVYQEDFNSFGELWRKIFHIKGNESKTLPDTNPAGRPRP